ncbi:hypothetical protein HB825_10860 [Listeria booriae]|uniref:glycosyl hydrolase family 28-related protein n=1 Tax=Listeria booriae TaxID=1552123 RepID=UPI0016259BF1|nr:glycosyl hydrolase family 28-related protein [Listeria booriae]MBC1525675.1 hypothetical protein [Listeria booriae]MBC6135333.1 hypothetical protein [Listeria booriae]
MKTIAKIWGAFTILLLATLFFSIDVNASTVSLVPNNESAASQNKTTLQRAINAANAGETITIPKGSYYLSGEIMVKSNITIQGEDMYTTKLYIDKGFVSPYIQISADTGLGVSNLTMKNMSMVMNPIRYQQLILTQIPFKNMVRELRSTPTKRIFRLSKSAINIRGNIPLTHHVQIRI